MEGLLSVSIAKRDGTARVSYKRTRRGKIRKLVRPVYFRDDISCGVISCSICSEKDGVFCQPSLEAMKRILIVDPETACTQTDFVLSDECMSNCVLSYTALNAVQQTNRARADKLRNLCKPHVDGDSNNKRSFYSFPNEFLAETFVPFPVTEATNSDRDFMSSVSVAKWYASHLAVPSENVLLIVSSQARKEIAVSHGVHSLTVWEYADSVRNEYPLAGENLAAPSEIGTESGEFMYPAHLSLEEIAEGVQCGRLKQGVLRMAMGTGMRGSVGTVEIVGKLDLNRAVDGDIVAFELFREDTNVDDGALVIDSEEEEDPGMTKETPTAVDDMAERILGTGEETSGRLRGRVVGIVKRNWKEYPGSIRSEADEDEHRQDRMFIPADPRIPFIRIRTRNVSELLGKRIVVVIDSWDRTSKSPTGHWIAIMGKAGDRDTESAVILREHGVITREFSRDVMACLPSADFKPSDEEISKRLDLRAIPVCSIDPPGCKDIDDALSCEPLPNGNFRVGVHIADVTHFVHTGTAIDLEAAERCTTVYLVEKRTDMLPGLLTADLCSLREKVDRLCFSVIWEMNKNGEIVKTEFHKAVIKSRASLTYAAAQSMIDDVTDNSELTISIRNLNILAKKIRQARAARGALELASQEVRFELDSETKDPTAVALYQSRDTNKLVEEFMVLANQSVARQILSHFPSISVLRNHPPPKESQLEILKDILLKQGYTDFKYSTNKELADSLAKLNRRNDPFFNRLVRLMTTRCMNQAAYFCTGDVDPGSFWHYGLAMDLYTHFTSPIRRYADVLVHRLLSASLGLTKLPDAFQTKSAIHTQCDVMNHKHKMAQLAGRASAELHIYLFFRKIGPQICDAVVTQVRKTKRGHIGLHVLSPVYGVEGVVTIPSGWSFDCETETATCVSDGISISVFDHVMVQVKADESNHRYRTIFEFLRKSAPAEAAIPYSDSELQNIQQKIFPDGIQADRGV
jgi:exosome complex exonuclease DIS3/RRP44